MSRMRYHVKHRVSSKEERFLQRKPRIRLGEQVKVNMGPWGPDSDEVWWRRRLLGCPRPDGEKRQCA